MRETAPRQEILQNLYGGFDPSVVRNRQDLSAGIDRIPGLWEPALDLDAVDDNLLAVQQMGRITVVDDQEIVDVKALIKFQDIPRAEFINLGNFMIDALLEQVQIQHIKHYDEVSQANMAAGISIRAGNSFHGPLERFFPQIDVGFISQTRDEETGEATSQMHKFVDVKGKHVILVDPMLATGGSLKEMAENSRDMGAERITTVSIFTAPQGLLRIASLEHIDPDSKRPKPTVDHMITIHLEAGLTPNFFIIGPDGRPLGDWGDRRYGVPAEANASKNSAG